MCRKGRYMAFGPDHSSFLVFVAVRSAHARANASVLFEDCLISCFPEVTENKQY